MKSSVLFLTCVLGLVIGINGYILDPGPVVKATKGEVWPKPQVQTKSDDYFVVHPSTFEFSDTGIGCQNFIQDAFTRYWTIIRNSVSLDRRGRFAENGRKKYKKHRKADAGLIGTLATLNVVLDGTCTEDVLPNLQMSENYTLTVTEQDQTLAADSIWGILRGLESFSQLLYLEEDELRINSTTITDYPRFPHRGLLLDTARHFIPLYAIYNTLDAMAFNKFNVFHWHITDDHSFPYKSLTFPLLSERGAYHPVSKVYEPTDVQRVIEFARLRGIRVIPELDTPGHTRSWGVAYPALLTECYDENGKTGQLGPMDPTQQYTYDFIRDLFTEIVKVFPDEYFHIGGDEVGFECWESNPDVTAYMAANNITTYADLEAKFIQQVVGILDDLNSKKVVWEEVFTNGVEIPDSTLVHVWTDWNGMDVVVNATKAGKTILYSSCWYLDHLSTGGDWLKFYQCEPYNFNGTDAQKGLILGGEACMWSESVNENNLASRLWPRASAAAEKLWSAFSDTDANNPDNTDFAARRLEEHACRMNNRGITAQPPNGPGVCL